MFGLLRIAWWGAGHSLGGALATLTAYDLQAEFGFRELQCYTFGCPRTGNHAFARDYERVVPDTWHVVNDRAHTIRMNLLVMLALCTL